MSVGNQFVTNGSASRFVSCVYWFCAGEHRHIQNYYLSNSRTFQDGNGNGNFEEINSNDFLDGNWESMEMKG